MSHPRPLVTLPELSAMLAERIEALCRELLAGGHRAGGEWVEARRRQGGLGDSLSVRLTGAKRGTWGHPPVRGAPGGDALDLVAYVLFGGNKGEAARWAKRWLGIEHAEAAEIATRRRQASRQQAAISRQVAEDAEKMRRRARALWLAGQPIADTPAEAYLRGRGIDLRRLGRAPGALRFSWEVWCAEAGARLPAMLAAVSGPFTDADGVVHEAGFLTCHRTWLEHDAAGGWRKATLESPKKVYSAFAGGWIPLSRGSSRKPLRDAPDGDQVVLTEGIEDALTLAMVMPELRCLAAVALPNIANIALPKAIGRVTIFADNDGDNMHAAAALARGIDAQRLRGHAVFLARPPDGFKDANDALNHGG